MKGPLNRYTILFALRHFIVFCLVTSVLIKSVSVIFVQLTDIKIEFYADFEENTSNENELNTDFESEERLFFMASLYLIRHKKEPLEEYFNLHENLLDFNPNIQLPPPKV